MSHEDIKKRLRELKINPDGLYLSKKELNELSSLLKENLDENIFYAICGNKEKKRILLICTNKRLIMFESSFFFGFTKTDFSFNKISAISSKKSFMFGELQFRVGGQNIVIEGLEKSLLQPFVDAVNKGMNNLYNKKKKSNTSVLNKQKDQPKLDAVDEIRRYKELLDEGILTKEEFENKKQQLLNLDK